MQGSADAIAATAFDEMTSAGPGDPGGVRPAYAGFARWLARHGTAALEARSREAEALFRRIGVTFSVYTDGGDPERLIPFCVVPRVLARAEWDALSRGLGQRVRALNAFLTDVYGPRRILAAGLVPADLVLGNEGYRREMEGFVPPGGVWTTVSGIDMVRTSAERFVVLEDNCRIPSGVSYMLENREAMLRLLPGLCGAHRIAPVSHYPEELLDALKAIAPRASGPGGEPTVVVLTPGPYNSAYYEHAFLADEMGVELVEGQDLFCDGPAVYMRTTAGPRRVDVVYRRVDDEWLDPDAFRPDSALGARGLMAAYRAGGVALANAPGAGVADDKAIYPYVPAMVRFYLGEEPVLGNVETFMCARPDHRSHVLANLDRLVVKLARGAGGYGMLVGPHATAAQREEFAARVAARPEDYIAQPTLALSTVPTLAADGRLAPRHVDLRPFVLTGREVRTVPGGLTRVALREGSLVVNSSQGGGTKDTWVLEDDGGGARQSMGPGGMGQRMGGMEQSLPPPGGATRPLPPLPPLGGGGGLPGGGGGRG